MSQPLTGDRYSTNSNDLAQLALPSWAFFVAYQRRLTGGRYSSSWFGKDDLIRPHPLASVGFCGSFSENGGFPIKKDFV